MIAESKGGDRIHLFDRALPPAGPAYACWRQRQRRRRWGMARPVARARQAREELKMWFAIDTLSTFARGGRIGGARAWIGSALKIKPILTSRRRSLRSSASARGHVRSSNCATTPAQRHESGARRLGRPAHPGLRDGGKCAGRRLAARYSAASPACHLGDRRRCSAPTWAQACSASAASRRPSWAEDGPSRRGDAAAHFCLFSTIDCVKFPAPIVAER